MTRHHRLLLAALALVLLPAPVGHAAAPAPPCVTDDPRDDGIMVINDDTSAPIDEGHEYDLRHVQIYSDRTTLRVTMRVGDLARVATDPIWGASYTVLLFPPGKRLEDGPGFGLVADWLPTGPRFTIGHERLAFRVPTHPVAFEHYEWVEIGPATGAFQPARGEITITAPLASWQNPGLRKGARLIDFVIITDRIIDPLTLIPGVPHSPPLVVADYARSQRGTVHVIGSGTGCRRAAS